MGTVYSIYALCLKKIQSDTNPRNLAGVLRVYKSKRMDTQGQKFESLSTVVYGHKRIHFNFTLFRI